MTTLNITFTDSCAESFPLFAHYSGQHFPQPAFISLDIEDGECTAGYSGEIGNAVPVSVWHNRVLRFKIEPKIRADKILELIEAHRDDFQVILDGASVEWDGNNNVGRFNSAAQAMIEHLEQNLPGESSEFAINIIRDQGDLYEYLSDIYPQDGQSVEDFADEIINNVDYEHYSLSDNMNHCGGMLSCLSDIWANNLYGGDELPQIVAQYLVNEGTCANSQWVEELAAMANGTYCEEDF